MAEGCRTFFEGTKIDVIVPVPLHPKRLRWRGFNQSLILSNEVGKQWRIPVDPFLLVRTADTNPQTQLPQEARRRNVRGVFALGVPRWVKKQNVLVVDDVYTSGATVNECSRTLLRAGAKEVRVLTLARTIF